MASIEELFFNTNAKTAILVGQARGVAILACVKGGLEIFARHQDAMLGQPQDSATMGTARAHKERKAS